MVFTAAQPAVLCHRRRSLRTFSFLATTWMLAMYATTRVPVAQCVAQNVTGDWSQDAFEPEMFSPQWAAEVATENASCDAAVGSFKWKPHGFGSNVNSESVAQFECLHS